jgi:hypothetical protein
MISNERKGKNFEKKNEYFVRENKLKSINYEFLSRRLQPPNPVISVSYYVPHLAVNCFFQFGMHLYL